MKKTNISDNLSNKSNITIPSLQDIADRFYDIDICLKVKIDHCGYLKEIGSYAPFNGIVSVRKIINILDRDINVIMERDEDLIKLRNSIIFFNEYFVPNPELNIENLRSAPTAFSRIETQYINKIGEVKQDIVEKNPFKNNLIQLIYENETNLSDDEIDRYMKNRRKKESMTKLSSNKNQKNNTVEQDKSTLHSKFCKNIPRTVDMSELEFCFENVQYIN